MLGINGWEFLILIVLAVVILGPGEVEVVRQVHHQSAEVLPGERDVAERLADERLAAAHVEIGLAEALAQDQRDLGDSGEFKRRH